jgi:hypothetical protein
VRTTFEGGRLITFVFITSALESLNSPIASPPSPRCARRRRSSTAGGGHDLAVSDVQVRATALGPQDLDRVVATGCLEAQLVMTPLMIPAGTTYWVRRRCRVVCV